MKFAVHTLPETYEPTLSDIVGVIYVQADDYAFPDKGWTDFGVEIVGWWLDVLSKLLSGAEKRGSCKFMDGPFRYDLEANDNGGWHIRFIKEYTSREECVLEGDVKAEAVVAETLDAARTLLELCRSKNLNSHVDYLKGRHDEVERNQLALTGA